MIINSIYKYKFTFATTKLQRKTSARMVTKLNNFNNGTRVQTTTIIDIDNINMASFVKVYLGYQI